MAILISGILVIASFLVASVLLFGAFLTTSVTQGQALKELTEANKQVVGSGLNITSATASDNGGGTDIAVQVDNTGSQSVGNFARMDAIVRYTDPADNPVLTYLAYNAAGAGNNEWTVPATGIQPDAFNPGIWDPDETLTMDLRVVPAIKSGTSALIVVATPWGVNDQTSVTN